MAACVAVSSGDASRIGDNLAPFNPSMQPVVDIALELLQLKSDDVLYELGCGDGRVMVRSLI
jgi:precorrin-6B methylase 2